MKLDKIIFAVDDNPEFDNFWEINSEICQKKLGVTPVLFKISDRDSDFINDSFGLVKYVKSIPDVDTGFQAQIFRMYGSKYFPNEVVMTSDIDMLLFSRDYIVDSIGDISEEDLVILNSDAYDENRPECTGIFSTPDRYPICYVVAKGSTFNKVIRSDVDFSSYCSRLQSLNLGRDTDEIYFGRCVNSQSQVKVHKVTRGYSSNFYCPRRIEKHNFHRSEIFSLDLEKSINIESFIDCHCARPYITHKVAIDNIRDKVLSSTKKEIYLIGCHVENDRQKELLSELVDILESNNKKFVLASHTVLPNDIVSKSYGFVYDSENPKYKTWDLEGFPLFFFENDFFRLDSPYITYGAADYYHVGAIKNFINGINFLKCTDYEIVHWLEYDSLPDFDLNESAKDLLTDYDFIFYGVGSRFSFNLSKVNNNFLNLTSDEIFSGLKSEEYIAERFTGKNLTSGNIKTILMNESKTNTWGRYSQNFDNVKINWSLFEDGNLIKLFVHNITDLEQNLEIKINDDLQKLNLVSHNWSIIEVSEINKLSHFEIKCDSKKIVSENLSDKNKYNNIIKKVLYTKKNG